MSKSKEELMREQEFRQKELEANEDEEDVCEFCGGTGIREDANGVDHKCLCRDDCGHDVTN